MKKLFVEIADTHVKREYGLMDRKSLHKDEGMLFKFPKKQTLSFWMRNTYVPLDIAFVDDNGKIFQISSMEPLSTKTVVSNSPCKYALEVEKGWFDKNNISVGSKILNLDISNQKKFAQSNVDVMMGDQQTQQDKQDGSLQLGMSIRGKLEYATNHNLPLMILYRTMGGNTLPPRKLLPIPGEGYPIESGKNGYHFKAWDASPSIDGVGLKIDGGHPKSFMLDGIVNLEIIDEGEDGKTNELRPEENKNENKF